VNGTLRICVKLTNQEFSVTEECVAIQVSQVVSRYVFSMTGELDARTLPFGSVRS